MDEIPLVVAAFDFDGTLTRHDTLRVFLWHCAGPRRFVQAVLCHLPLLLRAAAAGGKYRDDAKCALVRSLLADSPEWHAQHCAEQVASRVLQKGLRPDVCERLAWHLANGHYVVIVSGSFEAYVGLVAKQLGVDQTLATNWEVGRDGRLTGRLKGANVRGSQKAALLQQHLGAWPTRLYAYGDSRSDQALLSKANEATWVRWWAIRPMRRESWDWLTRT